MPKGVYFRTETHCENISKALKGNPLLIAISLMRKKQRGYYKSQFGKDNPMFGKHHSEKTREKQRKGMLEYMENHKRRFKVTKIEKMMKRFLDFLAYLNVIKKFEFQFRIKKYLVDFYVPEWKLIIECFGTYWHSFKKKKTKDKRRIEFLEKKGYKVLVFWEDEILKFENLLI